MNIGIDIGTTYSACSYINKHNDLVIVKDKEFDANTTPSVIYLGTDSCLVGQAALDRITVDPEITLCWLFKRNIGTNTVIASDGNGKDWKAEGLTALLIKKLVKDVEKEIDKKVEGATISVPVHFSTKQRSAIIGAAEIAGIRTVEIIDEPVAAAIYYGYSKHSIDQEKKILIFDLGGGTFDVTILLLNEKGFYTLASHGDNEVGGQDIDKIIMKMIAEQIAAKGVNIYWSAYNAQLLRKLAEKSKIEMSGTTGDYTAGVFLSGWSGSVTINREEYQSKVFDFFSKCFESTTACLSAASLPAESIDEHLFVGGSCKNPFLRTCYKNYFEIEVEKMNYLDPDLAIAYGACLYGQSNEPDSSHSLPELRGVMGYNLAIPVYNAESKASELEVIIAKNSPLPAINKRLLYKSYKEQKELNIELITYQDSELETIDLGSLTIGPLDTTRHNYEIELSIVAQKDGVIKAEVINLETGEEIEKSFSYLNEFDDYLIKQKLIFDKMIINTIV